jgi:Heterokaryon incompatibility protein (HET)
MRQLFHRSSIDKPHSYEALSYVWGFLSSSESLRCDGKSISITPNLRDALRKLRLVDRHRALWVDQICINQSDKDEKSSQVALMDRIYRMAEQVIAWLGPNPDGLRNIAYAFLVGIAKGKIEILMDHMLRRILS